MNCAISVCTAAEHYCECSQDQEARGIPWEVSAKIVGPV